MNKLREDMTETLLKDVRFDDRQMERIRERARHQKNPWFLSHFRDRFKAILSVGVCMVMILGIFYFAVQKSGIFDASHHQKALAGKLNTESSYSQDEVKNLILHRMRHFHSAIGKITSEDYRTHEGYTFQYQIRTGKHPAFRYNVISNTGHVLDKMVSNPQYTMEVLPEEQSYTRHKTKTTHMSYPAQGFIQKYLRKKMNWRILNVHSKFLQRNVLLIGGRFTKPDSIKLKAKSFKAWVDEKTGMVLKEVNYDGGGHPVTGFETTQLQFNQIIPKSVFQMKSPKHFRKRKKLFVESPF